MSSADQTAGMHGEVTPQQEPTGTTSLALGAAAVAAIGCPLLPDIFSTWIRYFPVYLIVPLGICAVVSGLVTLRKMRDQEGVDRRRAGAGVTLGTVAIVVPLAVIVWAVMALSQAYA